jgi:hypothetical protein
MFRTSSRGVIALLTVVIIGAVMLTLGIASALSGHVQVIVAGQSAMANDVRELAASCLEEGIGRMKQNPNHPVSTVFTVPMDSRSCTVTLTASTGSGIGATRTLSSVATVEGFTKTLVATLTWRQNASGNAAGWAVTSWTEQDPP